VTEVNNNKTQETRNVYELSIWKPQGMRAFVRHSS